VRNLVKVDKDLPLEILGPLGCGIQTGAGTVLNKLRPEAGSKLAVFGCGSVGLSAIMAAKLLGCEQIIGVDVHENRLELARKFGATHTVNARHEDTTSRLVEITGGGIDYGIEASGVPKVLRQAADSLVSGGTVALVGGTPIGTEVTLNMNKLLFHKTVTGVVQGNSIPQIFIPKLISLYRQGLFPFDELITMYKFEEINQAVADMNSGKVIKPVIKIAAAC
jgi:aryl-alcohol dehydrogenase